MADFREIILTCEDSFDGIMTAVYDGWVLLLAGNKVRIYPGDDYGYELFCEYRACKTNLQKAVSVVEAIQSKISIDAYEAVYRAAMHYDKERGNIILDFLKVGFRAGKKTTKLLADNRVMTLLELARKAGNEAHLFKEFIRFEELKGHVLFSKIEPKCEVVPLLYHHFQNRYPQENWIIYDVNRKEAAVHRSMEQTVLVMGQDMEELTKDLQTEDEYESLWKIFYQTIAIESRCNPKCQNSHMPKWYRKHMPEHQKTT